MLNLINTRKIPFSVVETGDLINLDKALKIEVLHADEGAADTNDTSIVLKGTNNKVSFLLMGDADTARESQIIKVKKNVKATVLKVGHHGSTTSTSSTFVNAVKPSTSILSYGANNSYGHPDNLIKTRLTKANLKFTRRQSIVILFIKVTVINIQ